VHDTQGRILALLVLHRHTIHELSLLTREPEDRVSQAVVQLYHLKRIEAYAADGKTVKPPFGSETRFAVP